MSLNLLINEIATPSADITSEAPSGAPLRFMTSASEKREAMDIDRPALSFRFEAWLISKSSTSSELESSDKLSGDVEQGLTLVVAKKK